MTKLFSLFSKGEVHFAKGASIIPREVLGPLLSVEEVMTKAKSEIENLKKEQAEECVKQKQEAEEEGFAEGLERFNTHLIHFDKQIQELKLKLQEQILPLVIKAARKVVGEHLAIQPDAIVDIVMQALSPVLQNHRFTIYVNKGDKEALEASRSTLKEVLAHVQSLIIQERDDITPGGCIIETESGIINASLENQWRALESAFKKYMKK